MGTEAVLTEIGNALAKFQWRHLAVDTLNELRGDEDVKIVSMSMMYETQPSR